MPSTPLRSEPNNNILMDTECLFGESIEIIKYNEKHVFCKCIIDNYEGWINISDIGEFKTKTHKIISLRSFVHEIPDSKSNIILEVPVGSKMSTKSFSNGSFAPNVSES